MSRAARQGRPSRPTDGNLERGVLHVDPEGEAEEIDLEALLPRREHTEEPEHGNLPPGAARARPGEGGAGQVVLADGGGRQVEPQLGDGPCDVCDESIAVRAGPRAIARRIRIGGDGSFNPGDDRVDTVAPAVQEEIGATSKPVVVGSRPVHAYGGRAPVDAPAHHFVTRVLGGPARFERNPRVHGQDASPTHGARGIDLKDGFGRGSGSGGLAGRVASELPPVAAGPAERRAAGCSRKAARTRAELLRRIAEGGRTDALVPVAEYRCFAEGQGRPGRGSRPWLRPPRSSSWPPPRTWRPASSPSSPSLQRAFSFSWGAL